MNFQRLTLIFVVMNSFLVAGSIARADGSSSLQDAHKILVRAAGESPDSMPAPDQQKALLEQALTAIHGIPHVYHGRLNQASRDLEAALSELGSGDPAHKVRGYIFDADDVIKSIMP